MCLGVPGEIIEIYEENGLAMGKIDYSGTVNTVCLAYLEDVQVGQWVMVHAGFAITLLDVEDAKCSLETWNELLTSAARGDDVQINWDNTPSQGDSE